MHLKKRKSQGMQTLFKYIVGYTDEVMTPRHFLSQTKTAVWENTYLLYLTCYQSKKHLLHPPFPQPLQEMIGTPYTSSSDRPSHLADLIQCLGD